MFRIIFAFIVAIHGLIHLMGFIKAFKLTEISQLAQDISKPTGLLWLMSALLIITTLVAFLLKKDWWWMIATPAVILSQFLIIIHWQEAKFGTIANVIILASIIISYGIWSFNAMVKNELKSFLPPATAEKKVVTREMVAGLPPVVQKWLEHSNIISKEFVQTVHLKQKGEMCTAAGGKWMPFEAEQYFTTQKPGFIWLAEVKAAPGIHLAGRDKYEDGKGHMLIKFLSLFPVADVKGKEIDQGVMVRYLAEIVWFPSAALSNYIQWEQVDSTTAQATMTYKGITASSIYKFDKNGEVLCLEAKRYYDRKGGATLEDWFIQIEPNGYKEFAGVRIPAKMAVTWRLKEGDFTWLNLVISALHYNKDGNSPNPG